MATQAEVKAADEAAARVKAENERQAQRERDKLKVTTLTREINNLRKSIPSILKLINEAQTEISNVNNQKVTYINLNKDNPPPNFESTVNGFNSEIASYTRIRDITKNTLKDVTDKINAKLAEIATLNKKLYDTLKPGSTPKPVTAPAPKTTNPPKKEKKLKFSKDYKYNAPMVKSAYFGTPSFVDTVQEGNYISQGAFADARQSWSDVKGGRGVIQMDKVFLSTFTTSSGLKSPGKIDTQKYGFKFLYNPQTVSMAWGLMTSMDPYYEATQLDKFQVVATQLMQSTVGFELLLNRIEDFKVLNENGLIVPGAYSETIEPEDLAEIYKKGTMYDLEYLFKVINGPDATFVSQLNGTSADRGWMRPTIVELHLGDSMRYRVRISEFSVNHVIFNSRMVPMLSTVRLTCNRFPDGPTIPKADEPPTSSTSTIPGVSTWQSSPGASDIRNR